MVKKVRGKTIYKDNLERPNQNIVHITGGKVGATAGWTIGAAADSNYQNLPASQTASTLIVPVTGVKPGWKITGFYLIGCLQSAGGAVTLDANLRKQVAAAAAVPTDSSIATMTQIAKTAAVIINKANSEKVGLTEVVDASSTYYFVIKGTTAASTNIVLQGVVLEVTEE